MKFFIPYKTLTEKLFTFGTIICLGFLPKNAHAQLKTRITLVYRELQLNVGATQLQDTIQIYVKEPFKPRKLYQTADLHYETFIEFEVDEFCPVEVCKNNECFEIFIDSENVEVLIEPENFLDSRTINSPLSDTWRLVGLEREKYRDTSTDLFWSGKDSSELKIVKDKSEALYCERMNRFLRENSNNQLGWNLFLGLYEEYSDDEILKMTALFSKSIPAPSIKRFLVDYHRHKTGILNLH